MKVNKRAFKQLNIHTTPKVTKGNPKRERTLQTQGRQQKTTSEELISIKTTRVSGKVL